jgi:hypothetical protein
LGFDERDIHRLIEQQLRGKIWLERGDGTRLEIGSMIPIRRGFGTKKGRPDTVIWFKLVLSMLGVNIKAKYPILVEVGRAGYADAKVDFDSFFVTDEIEVPAMIAGGAKREEKILNYQANVKLNVVQLPFSRISAKE